MRFALTEQFALFEKGTDNVTPEAWERIDGTMLRGRTTSIGAVRAMNESARLQREITHDGLFESNEQLAAGCLLVRKSDDANFLVHSVEPAGKRGRGGRTSYLTAKLQRDYADIETA